MPKKSIDYSKTIMYKLCCNDLNIIDCYIGHTTDFTKRKSTHKSNCNNEKYKYYNLKVYQFIRDNGGWDNWTMVMIEEYNCSSLLEATKRERELYEELKATLNINFPSRNNKEYYQDNKDYYNNYRNNNYNKMLEYNKNYYQDNQDLIIEKSKIYYENNKVKVKEYKKEYRRNNLEILKNISHQKFNCECGGCYTYSGKSAHLKTKLHQNYSSSLLRI